MVTQPNFQTHIYTCKCTEIGQYLSYPFLCLLTMECLVAVLFWASCALCTDIGFYLYEYNAARTALIRHNPASILCDSSGKVVDAVYAISPVSVGGHVFNMALNFHSGASWLNATTSSGAAVSTQPVSIGGASFSETFDLLTNSTLIPGALGLGTSSRVWTSLHGAKLVTLGSEGTVLFGSAQDSFSPTAQVSFSSITVGSISIAKGKSYTIDPTHELTYWEVLDILDVYKAAGVSATYDPASGLVHLDCAQKSKMASSRLSLDGTEIPLLDLVSQVGSKCVSRLAFLGLNSNLLGWSILRHFTIEASSAGLALKKGSHKGTLTASSSSSSKANHTTFEGDLASQKPQKIASSTKISSVGTVVYSSSEASKSVYKKHSATESSSIEVSSAQSSPGTSYGTSHFTANMPQFTGYGVNATIGVPLTAQTQFGGNSTSSFSLLSSGSTSLSSSASSSFSPSSLYLTAQSVSNGTSSSQSISITSQTTTKDSDSSEETDWYSKTDSKTDSADSKTGSADSTALSSTTTSHRYTNTTTDMTSSVESYTSNATASSLISSKTTAFTTSSGYTATNTTMTSTTSFSAALSSATASNITAQSTFIMTNSNGEPELTVLTNQTLAALALTLISPTTTQSQSSSTSDTTMTSLALRYTFQQSEYQSIMSIIGTNGAQAVRGSFFGVLCYVLVNIL